jgi:hypothetical protein
LPVPSAAGKVLVQVHNTTVFEHHPPVQASDRLIAPPFVIDTPGLDDGLDRDPAAREAHSKRRAVFARLDLYLAGAV